MILWLDAQLSPQLATWLNAHFTLTALALRDLGLHDADDETIFHMARAQRAIIMTKDADFVALLQHHGPPPQIIWLTCGNTSNAHLQTLLLTALPQTLTLLAAGERLVEIRDR